MTTTSPAGTSIAFARPSLGPAEAAAAAEAVASGWVAQGPRVAAFEEAVADRIGAEHAVATSSGTAALHLALLLANIGPDDEVVVPSHSFMATTNVVRHVGATPVYADVDLATANLTPDTVAPVLGDRTRAVIVVHQVGVPADLDALHQPCDPLGVAVIEDAACALGSTYQGDPVGGSATGASLAAFSFHPRKVITTGEGGLLALANADLAARARRLRDHGSTAGAAERDADGGLAVERYLETGFNHRMSDVNAAVGLAQLARLDELLAARRHLAERYQQALAGVAGLTTVADPPHGRTNFQSFWVLLGDDVPIARNEVIARLADQGIATRRGVMAAHLEPAGAPFATAPLPVTERLTHRSLLLPLHAELDEGDQDRVIDALVAAIR